ncbi:hypothetical protein NITGR_290090 [Nitrospina gracilis 3/211]|uniref:Uncharacterized protein n=1 Tax=Nitrospina gracilis (strain 3/211) TaxID=1266370 RepID=M1YJ09_NITG3|nr:hypothetical protein NITGR_290090 [Nitrospina gracilis 3/211]
MSFTVRSCSHFWNYLQYKGSELFANRGQSDIFKKSF